VFFSAKVFCARKMLRIFLIGHKKPSFTAGTLHENFFTLVYPPLRAILGAGVLLFFIFL
jgi:hypothetical protein